MSIEMEAEVIVTPLEGKGWVVELVGEHDLATVPAVTEALDRIEGDGSDIVLDLSRTTFVDSTILGVIVEHAVKPREQVVVVASGGTKVGKVLDLVQLGSIVRLFETRDEALGALGADAA